MIKPITRVDMAVALIRAKNITVTEAAKRIGITANAIHKSKSYREMKQFKQEARLKFLDDIHK